MTLLIDGTYQRVMHRINEIAIDLLYEGWFEFRDGSIPCSDPCDICTMYREAIKELSNDLPI